MFLDAQAILNARDRKTATVPCPEWGGEVLVGTMGALDRARLGDWLEQQKEIDDRKSKDQDAESSTIITTDSPEGKPEPIDGEESDGSDVPDGSDKSDIARYTKLQNTELMVRYLVCCILDEKTYQPAFNLDQVEALGQKNPEVLNRLYLIALDLNADNKKAAEEIEKNSVGTPASASGGD